MTAFDSALRSQSNPDALAGRKRASAPGQGLLSADWGLDPDELPAGTWEKPLAGNVGGQWRVQEVRTPRWIIDAASEAMGGTIGLDPCAASDPAVWFAERNMSLCEEALVLEDELESIRKRPETRARQKELTALLKPYYLGGALKVDWGDWRDGAYVNPPFGFLERWIPRCQSEATKLFRRVVGLWPVRTHRPWWMRGHVGAEIVTLRYDVIFEGHEHAFPAPMCLTSWNCRIPPLGERETGRIRL